MFDCASLKLLMKDITLVCNAILQGTRLPSLAGLEQVNEMWDAVFRNPVFYHQQHDSHNELLTGVAIHFPHGIYQPVQSLVVQHGASPSCPFFKSASQAVVRAIDAKPR